MSTPLNLILNNDQTIEISASKEEPQMIGFTYDNVKLTGNKQYKIKVTYTSSNYRSQTLSLQWNGGSHPINNVVDFPIMADGLDHEIELLGNPKEDTNPSVYVGTHQIAYFTVKSFDVIDVATGKSVLRTGTMQLVEEYKNHMSRLWYPAGIQANLTVRDNSELPIDPTYPDFSTDDQVVKDLAVWTHRYLEDPDMVYESKDMLNALNSLVPLLGAQSLRYSEAPIDERVNWLDLSGNRLYEFVNIGDNGPDPERLLDHKGLVLVAKTPSNKNLAYIVFTEVSLAFKFGGVGNGNWFYFTTMDSGYDALKLEIMTILEQNYATKNEIPTVPNMNNYTTMTDFNLLSNRVTTQAGQVSDLTNAANGTNLYPNTKTMLSWAQKDNNVQVEVDSESGDYMLHLYGDGASAYSLVHLDKGQQYTFSVDIRGMQAGAIRTTLYSSSTTVASFGGGAIGTNVTGEWKRYVVTFTALATGDDVILRVEGNGTWDNVAGSIYVRHIKLEKGALATPWAPAPSDFITKEELAQLG